MITFTCPSCQSTLKSRTETVVGTVTCPKCQHRWAPTLENVVLEEKSRNEQQRSSYDSNKQSIIVQNQSTRHIRIPLGIAISVVALFITTVSIIFYFWSRPRPEVEYTPEQLYDRALDGTVLVIVADSGYGTGAMIESTPPRILTAYHVVGKQTRVSIMIPIRYRDGQVVTDPKIYESRRGEAIFGKVIKADPRSDLALIELDGQLTGAKPFLLTVKSTKPGESVASIGNSGANDNSMWRLSTGNVRNRSLRKAPMQDGSVIECHILETQSPTNPGDSGGPVLNRYGELVGIVCGYRPTERLVSWNVDIDTIRTFLGYKPIVVAGNSEPRPMIDRPEPLEKEIEYSVEQLITRLQNVETRKTAIRKLISHGTAGNTAVPVILELMLKDSDSSFQRDAMAALNAMGRYRGLPTSTLKSILKSEHEFALIYALENMARERAVDGELVPLLISRLSDRRPGLRERAARCCLADSPGLRNEALPKLVKMLDDQDLGVRTAAMASLESKRPFASSELVTLSNATKSAIPETRKWGVEEASRLIKSEADAKAILSPLIQDPHDDVILSVLTAITNWHALIQKELSLVYGLYKRPNPQIKRAVLDRLASIPRTTTIVFYLQDLAQQEKDDSLRERIKSIILKKTSASKADLPYLEKLLDSPSPNSLKEV